MHTKKSLKGEIFCKIHTKAKMPPLYSSNIISPNLEDGIKFYFEISDDMTKGNSVTSLQCHNLFCGMRLEGNYCVHLGLYRGQISMGIRRGISHFEAEVSGLSKKATNLHHVFCYVKESNFT